VEVPADFNFAFDVVDAIAAEDPGRLALVHVDDQGRRREFDFAFFRRESDRLAAGLARLGLRRGDAVMLLLFRRIEFWVSVLALHKLGAVAIPSPAMLSPADIRHRLAAARVAAVLAEDSLTATVDGGRVGNPGVKLLVQAGAASPPSGWMDYAEVLRRGDDSRGGLERSAGGRDPLFIFFSSGTTGAPKMVMHDHSYPLAHALTAIHWQDLKPGDLHLTIADTGWAKAAWGKLYGQWLAGATVFVHDFRGRFNAHRLLQVLAQQRVTTFCAPPTVYRLMTTHHDLRQYDLSALRHCVSAGELLNRDIFDKWQAGTGLRIFEGYGQTETTLQIATFPFMEPKPGSMGKPCPGWDIALLDERDQPVATREEGEICIRLNDQPPLGLFTGYAGDPDLTRAVMRDGYYRTGDMAWRDEDGYYWFIGRNDDLIKSSGYRIGPFEVESVLVTHPAVAEAAVTGVPDPVRGQLVKATIVLKPGHAPSEHLKRDIQDFTKKATAGYKHPRVIEFAPELPKTISGKIRRGAIRAQDAKPASPPPETTP